VMAHGDFLSALLLMGFTYHGHEYRWTPTKMDDSTSDNAKVISVYVYAPTNWVKVYIGHHPNLRMNADEDFTKMYEKIVGSGLLHGGDSP
jgi:hypothetical protein